MQKRIITGILLLISSSLIAQQDSSLLTKMAWSGYIESYYTHSFNQTQSRERPGFFYNFTREGEFNVNLAMLRAQISQDKYRAGVGLMAGLYPQYNLAAEQPLTQVIYEAYAGIRLAENLWFDAGIFPSHIGTETPLAFDNKVLTRNLASENSPYFLSGAKLSYQLEKWNFTAILCNGWQNVLDTVSRNPGFGFQASYQPSEDWLINYSGYIGDGVSDRRQVFYFNDIYCQIKIGEKWAIDAALDWGWRNYVSQNDPVSFWWNTVGIIRYQFNEKISASGRFEYFNDPNNVIFTPNNSTDFQITGWSFNIDWLQSEYAMLRLEARHLMSNDQIFENDQGFNQDDFMITASLAVHIK